MKHPVLARIRHAKGEHKPGDVAEFAADAAVKLQADGFIGPAIAATEAEAEAEDKKVASKK